MTDADTIWAGLAAAAPRTLADLFKEGDRLSRMTIEETGILFDFAKTHLDGALLDGFVALAEAQGLAKKRDALFAGEIVNPSEGRAAEHPAERGEGAADSVARSRAYQTHARALIDAIEADVLGPIRHILHIGIGGSALGPDLLIDALGRDADRYDVAVVSNVDGLALDEATAGFDPSATLVVVVSKTFTTTETLLNAESALAWLSESGVEDPYGRVIAVTAAPAKAVEWGVDETRVLPFAESVGGRYSLWSSVSFAVALALGWDAFETMLEGAAAMDRHFRSAEPTRNAPVMAAFTDLYYAVVRGAETRATFAYDERLRLLPSYLQQLEMESNGKASGGGGRPTAPIVWGGVGTDAQHAVFQLLHQGTHLVPVEFVAAVDAVDAQDEAHHRALLVNAFAQGAALMAGKTSDDPDRFYPGDRPSSTILLDRVDPARLGALLAFYEHRVFTVATLLGINPYDQFGVELGKQIARSIEDEGTDRFDASTRALIQRALR